MHKYLPIILALFLFGCSDDKEERLEGRRIPIILEAQSLQADVTLRGEPVTIARPVAGNSWFMNRGNAIHNPGNVAYSNAFEGKWNANIGNGGNLSAPPLVAGGYVFAMDSAYRLTALNSENGRVRWQTALAQGKGTAFGGGIALYRGRIFASDGFGTVTAVSAETGKVEWTRNLLTPIRATPVVESDIVIVTSIDNRATALNVNDGSVLWRHQGFQENVGVVGTGSPAIAGNVAIVPYSSGEVYGLRMTDGGVLWQVNLTAISRSSSLSELGDISADPVVDETGRVYAISNGGRLSSIDIASGSAVWEHRISGSETPVVSGDYIFVISNSSQILAIRKADGAVRWERQLQHWKNPNKRDKLLDWKAPLLLDGKLFLANGNGDGILMDSGTGDILQEIPLSGSVALPPVVSDGVLYILYDNANLSAYK